MAAATLVSGVAEAQKPAKAFRVGFLISAGSDTQTYSLDAFRQSMHDLGYIEGRDVSYVMGLTQDNTEAALSQKSAELVALALDVVVVSNTLPVLAMMRATRTMPIVMLEVGDPVGTGLVASLARPGGNVTGMTNLDGELSGKRLELLKEVAPQITRVGTISTYSSVTVIQRRNADTTANALGLELLHENVDSMADLDRAFAAIADWRGGGLLRLGGFRSRASVRRMVDLAQQHRLPNVTDRAVEVEQGALMSYGPNTAASFRQAAGFVDRILKGNKAADLPVQAPTKFELVINMKAARALGLAIPPAILARADEVIE